MATGGAAPTLMPGESREEPALRNDGRVRLNANAPFPAKKRWMCGRMRELASEKPAGRSRPPRQAAIGHDSEPTVITSAAFSHVSIYTCE